MKSTPPKSMTWTTIRMMTDQQQRVGADAPAAMSGTRRRYPTDVIESGFEVRSGGKACARSISTVLAGSRPWRTFVCR